MVQATTPRRRAYTDRKYQMILTITGLRISKDPKGRIRCDFWGRFNTPTGHQRNIPCVAIGPNYERIKPLLVNGREIRAWGVYETARPARGMTKPFHLIAAYGSTDPSVQQAVEYPEQALQVA